MSRRLLNFSITVLLLTTLSLAIPVRGQTPKKRADEKIEPKTIISKALTNYVAAQKVIAKDFAYKQMEIQSTFDYKTGSITNELDTFYEVLDGEVNMHRRAIPDGSTVGVGKFERVKKMFDINAVLNTKFLDKLDFQIQPQGEVVISAKNSRRFFVFTFQVNEKLKGSDFADDNIKKALPVLNRIAGVAEIWCDSLTFKQVSVKMTGERVRYYAPPILGGHVIKVEAIFDTQDLENGLTVPKTASMAYKYNTSFLFASLSKVNARKTYIFGGYKKMTFADKMEMVLSVSGQPLYKPHEATGLPRTTVTKPDKK